MLLLLRVILLILIIRAVLMLVRGIQEGARTGGPPAAGRVQLMRDPVCGVYIAPDKAITATRGAGTAYFCSEQCRQAWERDPGARVRRA